MSSSRRSDERCRCCECGRKFTPARSAAKTQKTCSAACRLKRRAAQARARYAADLETSRKEARERKGAWRRRVRAGPAPPARSDQRRIALPAEVVQVIEQEMRDLSSRGWPRQADVEVSLLRVARSARDAEMSLTSLS